MPGGKGLASGHLGRPRRPSAQPGPPFCGQPVITAVRRASPETAAARGYSPLWGASCSLKHAEYRRAERARPMRKDNSCYCVWLSVHRQQFENTMTGIAYGNTLSWLLQKSITPCYICLPFVIEGSLQRGVASSSPSSIRSLKNFRRGWRPDDRRRARPLPEHAKVMSCARPLPV